MMQPWLARKVMLEWELKAESKDLDADESIAFWNTRTAFFQAEKLQALSLKQKSRVNWVMRIVGFSMD